MLIQSLRKKYDKLAHLLLSFFLVFIFHGLGLIWGVFNFAHAITFMICIELTQIDAFGIKGRIQDTLLDLLMDGVGIGLGLILLHLLF